MKKTPFFLFLFFLFQLSMAQESTVQVDEIAGDGNVVHDKLDVSPVFSGCEEETDYWAKNKCLRYKGWSNQQRCNSTRCRGWIG
ncbi:MAG: hypothetical protein AAFZ15_25500 [Bacteroidota bacterium]